MRVLSIGALGVALIGVAMAHAADQIPRDAEQYRRTLVRAAHLEWGLDAPIATLAGQVHQESRWRHNARSPVGAEGLAQFMPATSAWMAEVYPDALGPAQPYNPGWALRAMVAYDRWLYTRNQASSDCDRWAFVLSAYNGGQGWVIRDRSLASAQGADKLAWFDAVERFNAGRSVSNFRENRNYPRFILLRWEPLYSAAGWGTGACAGRSSHDPHHAAAVPGDATGDAGLLNESLVPQLVQRGGAVLLAPPPRSPRLGSAPVPAASQVPEALKC